MVDTGAAVSLLGKDTWSLLGGTSKYTLQQWSGSRLVGVEGSPVPVHGVTVVEAELGGHMVNIDFVVVDGLKVESIIGLDFLGKYGCIINLQERVLLFRGTSVPLHNTMHQWHTP